MTKFNFSKVRFVVHDGDLDGAVAAAILGEACPKGVRFIATRAADLARRDLPGPSVLVDLAPNNQDMAGWQAWVEENTDHIVAVFDHHQGSEHWVQALGECVYIDTKQPSCPALLASLGFAVKPEWLEAANFQDTAGATGQDNEARRVANGALKVPIATGDFGQIPVICATVRQAYAGDDSAMRELAAEYNQILIDTHEAAAQSEEPWSGVRVAHIGGTPVDITELMVALYACGARYAVIGQIEKGRSTVRVGAKPGGKNLLEHFGLASGNPSRVVLPGTIADHRQKLEELTTA